MQKRVLTRENAVFLLLIFILGFLVYQQYTFTLFKEQTNTNLIVLQDNFNKQLEASNTNLNNKINTLNEETVKSDEKILRVVSQLEKTSSTQIEELSSQLKDVQIKSQDFSAIIENVVPAVVGVSTPQSLGSGATITEDGFIITNYHVIDKDKDNVQVFTSGDNVYDAVLVGFNQPLDVAILKIDASGLDYLEFADTSDIKVGDKVIAVGNPYGLSFSVTEGIISAVNREGANGYEVYAQTDVPINPGNSGGPLINLDSKIVGINNFKVGNAEGLGFALQADTAKKSAFDIIEKHNATP
ncbi:trypsin-like peptidase domain-containing protein [Candidatus Woesearchaeota archaeon]|nr:trypsin-like peptidase domain-containing protein [Candidatus Woesearchaeota archaeon]